MIRPCCQRSALGHGLCFAARTECTLHWKCGRSKIMMDYQPDQEELNAREDYQIWQVFNLRGPNHLLQLNRTICFFCFWWDESGSFHRKIKLFNPFLKNDVHLHGHFCAVTFRRIIFGWMMHFVEWTFGRIEKKHWLQIFFLKLITIDCHWVIHSLKKSLFLRLN